MRGLIFSVALAACAGAVAAEIDFAEAKRRADADEASLTREQTQALIQAQARMADDAFGGCPPESTQPDLSPFTVVMQLDGTGKVVRTWYQGQSPMGACVHGRMAKATLSVPPRVPFYTSFEMHWQ